MNIVNVTVGSNESRLTLGIAGENLATQIVFDISALITTYGQGTAIMLAKRSQDTDPYPCSNVEQSGNTLTWTITNIDTACIGHGRAELFWYVDNALAKTIVYRTFTAPDIGTNTEAPDPYDSWIESLTELAAQIRSDGEEYVADAEAWAVGERNGTPVASTDETYENNSKYWAEQSEHEADRAEQAANEAGYMELQINTDGQLIYIRTDAVDVDFSIDTTNGTLIMEAV